MEQNRNYVVFLVLGIMGFIMGVLYCLTIAGLIIGIPMIMGAKKYLAWSKMKDEEVIPERQSVIGWAVFYSIFTFPVGLISIIPAFNLKGEAETAAKNAGQAIKNVFTPKDPMQAKIDKIQKLAEMKEKGLIDEEDFKLAKARILSE